MATWAEQARTANGIIPFWKRPQSLNAEINDLERQHATGLTLARILMRLYWNLPIATRSLPNISAEQDIERYAVAANRVANQLGFNLLRDLIDGMAARVCKEMSCKVTTMGGDASLSQQAVKMARLLDGLNLEAKTRELGERGFIDACTCRGFGALKVYFDAVANEMKLMRTDPMGVFFRYCEGENPRNLYSRTAVPREYLCDTYPRKADAIMKVSTDRRPLIVGVEPSGSNSDDTVMVNEAWRLKRGDSNGKWVMTCDQIVLEDEVYPYDFHQLILFRVFPEYVGAGGVSLARLGAPYHRWENQLQRIAYESFRGAAPRIKRHEGTLINQGGYSDLPFSELVWSGTEEPKVEVGDSVSQQLLNYMPTIRHQAHVDTGVNEALSTGMKPAGINSGAALREYRSEFADARLNGPNERWADMWSDIGKAQIGIAAEHYKNDAIVVRAPGSATLMEIRWKDVDIRKSRYRLQFEASSALSKSLAGRMQGAQDLQALGATDNIGVVRMVAKVCPDIAAEADRFTAPRDLAIKMCEDALDGQPQSVPTMGGPEFSNDIIRIGWQLWCLAQIKGDRTPEQKECLRKVMRQAKRKQSPPIPPTPIAPPAPPLSAGATQPVGMSQPAVAHNSFEAASMGTGQAAQPPTQ